MSPNTSLENFQTNSKENATISIALGEFGLIHAGTVAYLNKIQQLADGALFVAIFPNWDKENSKQLLRTDEKFRLIQMMENVKGVILLSEDLNELATIKQTAPDSHWFIHANEKNAKSNMNQIQNLGIQAQWVETNEDCTTENILQRMETPAKTQ